LGNDSDRSANLEKLAQRRRKARAIRRRTLIFRLQHPHPRRQRRNLFLQIFAPQFEHLIAGFFASEVFEASASDVSISSSAASAPIASSDFFSFSACVFHSAGP
jgi:hypothetical protein